MNSCKKKQNINTVASYPEVNTAEMSASYSSGLLPGTGKGQVLICKVKPDWVKSMSLSTSIYSSNAYCVGLSGKSHSVLGRNFSLCERM